MIRDEITYRPKKAKTLLFLILSLLFTVGGLNIIPDEPVKGWIISIFFGICLLVFVIQLIPGASELKLTNEGFEITNFFRKNVTRWKDVNVFEVGYIGRNKTIKFDYNENHNEHQFGKTIAKSLSGKHAALPDTYGLKATELAEIMNVWKNKYGA